jgi:hypothetical protein
MRGQILSRILRREYPVDETKEDRLRNGKFDLYDFTTGTILGFIEIFEKSGDKIYVTYKADAVKGQLETLSKEYSFDSFETTEFLLENKVSKNESYWIGTSGEVTMLIIEIFNTRFHKSIPPSVYNVDYRYYMCSVISSSRMIDFINSDRSSLPLYLVLTNNINESRSSGLFVDKGKIRAEVSTYSKIGKKTEGAGNF